MPIVPFTTSDIMKGIYTCLIVDDNTTPGIATGTPLQTLLGASSEAIMITQIQAGFQLTSGSLPVINFYKSGNAGSYGVRENGSYKIIVTGRDVRSNLYNILERVQDLIVKTFAMPSGSLYTLVGRPSKVSETGETFNELDKTFSIGSEFLIEVFKTF